MGRSTVLFNLNGKVIVDLNGYHDFAYAMAIQNDGKIVLSGTSYLNGNDKAIAVTRFNPGGSIDSTFDFDGKRTYIFQNYSTDATSMVIQPDGKIVIGGV